MGGGLTRLRRTRLPPKRSPAATGPGLLASPPKYSSSRYRCAQARQGRLSHSTDSATSRKPAEGSSVERLGAARARRKRQRPTYGLVRRQISPAIAAPTSMATPASRASHTETTSSSKTMAIRAGKKAMKISGRAPNPLPEAMSTGYVSAVPAVKRAAYPEREAAAPCATTVSSPSLGV